MVGAFMGLSPEDVTIGLQNQGVNVGLRSYKALTDVKLFEFHCPQGTYGLPIDSLSGRIPRRYRFSQK